MAARYWASKVVGLAAALVAITFTLDVPAWGDFMFFHGGHSYLTVTTPATWANAAASAKSRQFAGVFGQLARIDNAAENSAIFSALMAHIPVGSFTSTDAPDGGRRKDVWLGATDRQTEGRWIWDGDADGTGDRFCSTKTGSPVGGLFNKWGINNSGVQAEPDNFSPGQDAAGISLNGWPQGTPGSFLGQRANGTTWRNRTRFITSWNLPPCCPVTSTPMATSTAVISTSGGRPTV